MSLKMRKMIGLSLLLLAALLVSRQWPASGAEAVDRAALPAEQEGGRQNTVERLREGTILSEQAGRFQPAGDRLMFYLSENGQRLGTLENLNLERIAKLVVDSPDPLEWIVSGMVTEYQGVNYLLVERAVLKTRLQRRSAGQK
jgi:hypothetical protein